MEWIAGTYNIAAVIIVFSLLIFVHELGHFLAALLTGVRVERFMLGFDVWGAGLRRTIRGIEFGVGALPLGGYVKLKGQSDLPGEEEVTGAPDELMSKGPGARAFIFAAGVIMNLLFGFVLLTVAELHGVPRVPPVIESVYENGPAARAGLEGGDRVLSVNGQPVTNFTDLQMKVAFSAGEPVFIEFERRVDGEPKRMVRRVNPIPSGGRGNIHKILAFPEMGNQIAGFQDRAPGVESAREKLRTGDRIVAVGDTEYTGEEGGQLLNAIRSRPGESTEIAVMRDGERMSFPVQIGAMGSYPIGIRLKTRISRVVAESPAEEAGLEPEDWVVAIDGKPLTRDHTLAGSILEASFREIPVTVLREGSKEELTVTPAFHGWHPAVSPGKDTYLGVKVAPSDDAAGVEVTGAFHSEVLREGDRILALAGEPLASGTPLGNQVERAASRKVTLTILRDGERREISMRPRMLEGQAKPMIGIVYDPRGLVHRVKEGSIAEGAGLSPGDTYPSFSFSEDLAETTLRWERSGAERGSEQARTVKTPEDVVQNPTAHGLSGSLGLQLRPRFVQDRAPTVFAAVERAAPDALDKVLSIYRFLALLVSGEFSFTAVGGPVLIFQQMYVAADVGLGKLLDLAAFISINLAVLNLLPIPVLDGGHLIFLLMEWVSGRRPSAKVREYAQYAGMVALLALMLMVIGVDLYYTLGG